MTRAHPDRGTANDQMKETASKLRRLPTKTRAFSTLDLDAASADMDHRMAQLETRVELIQTTISLLELSVSKIVSNINADQAKWANSFEIRKVTTLLIAFRKHNAHAKDYNRKCTTTMNLLPLHNIATNLPIVGFSKNMESTRWIEGMRQQHSSYMDVTDCAFKVPRSKAFFELSTPNTAQFHRQLPTSGGAWSTL